VLVVVALGPASAGAQGHRGAPPGQLRKTPSGTTSPQQSNGAAVEVSTPVAVRAFGFWLDDATLAAPGSLWLTASLTRWAAPAGSGVDAPAIGAAIGLTRRLQWSLSVPYSRFTPASSSGPPTTGLGTVYAGLKVLVIDPATHRIGLSATPTLEIVDSTTASAMTEGRAHAVLPLSFEAGHGRGRVYGSVGYFTRGATFAAGALEARLSPKTFLTAALMQSWSTFDADTATALGLSRRRTDVSGGVTAFVAPTTAVFVSVGRTISHLEFDSARVVLTAGLSIGVAASLKTPVRPPR